MGLELNRAQVLQARQHLILAGKNWLAVQRPGDRQVRVIPNDPALTVRRVLAIDLIEDLAVVSDRAVAVSEAAGHPKLFATLCGQFGAYKLALSGRACADIHRDIENRALQRPDQLTLGVRRQLEVQAA
jgi:hypothetical protein